MKLYKNILLSFFTAIVTVVLVYGGYTIYAQGNYSFREGGLSFDEVFQAYHGEMNEYFNAKVFGLNEILDQPDFFENPEFNIPPIDPLNDDFDTKLAACENNLSTYCVSVGALDRYIDYVNVLNNLVGTLAMDVDDRTIENILLNTAERNERLKAEFAEARKVMEATIATYNEYRLAYPMHKRYEQIMEDLIKYKLALKDIRRQAVNFPIKFIDATSDQCK